MLLAGYFSVSGRGIKACMAKVFLEHPETIAGVVFFHGMDGEGISKTVRAYTTRSTCHWVHKAAKAGPGGTIVNDLPRAMPVYAKNHLFAVLGHRPATLYVVLQQCQRIVI
jgi:hypothetical protein